jgi:NAD(P)-binding Rossmann-like domain
MPAASLKESPPIHNGHSVIQEADASGLNTKDRVIENFRPMSVVIIGAGFSGIYLGVRIPERLRNVKLTIYEKNAGVGGTWYENRYPGCACDIPGRCIVTN